VRASPRGPVRVIAVAGRAANACHRRIEYGASASSAMLSSMATRWPMAVAVVPPPIGPGSMIAVRQPIVAAASAQAVPMMPPPTMMRSKQDMLRRYSPGERVFVLHDEGAARGDVGVAGDNREHAAPGGSATAFEDAAEDAFLLPHCAGVQLAVGHQAGQLGAGAGAARRPVPDQPGAEDESARVDAVGGTGGGQFDVVDFCTFGAADALLIQCVTKGRGKRAQGIAVGRRQRQWRVFGNEEPVAA